MLQKNKILIAIDGSESSMDAVRYTSGFFDPKTSEITLMHIISSLPEDENPETVASYEKMKKQIQVRMEESVTVLENAGYDKKTIGIKIQEHVKGVSKDIITESEKGYDVLIIGRRGLNDPTSIIVGATAYRMMKAIKHLPVVIVGDKPDPDNILIGLDGSDSSINSLDFVCELMTRPSRKVILCHIVHAMEKENIEKQSLQVESTMQKAKERLVAGGFKKSMIESVILEGILSRAVAISKTAEKHHCGSLVVGRRGLSVISEFMMGRVTMKILHKAHTQAVWIA